MCNLGIEQNLLLRKSVEFIRSISSFEICRILEDLEGKWFAKCLVRVYFLFVDVSGVVMWDVG